MVAGLFAVSSCGKKEEAPAETPATEAAAPAATTDSVAVPAADSAAVAAPGDSAAVPAADHAAGH